MGLNAVGGIFNTPPSPHALLAWAAYAILVAYAYGLRLLLGGGLLLLCAYTASLWMAATGGLSLGPTWDDRGPSGVFPGRCGSSALIRI